MFLNYTKGGNGGGGSGDGGGGGGADVKSANSVPIFADAH